MHAALSYYARDLKLIVNWTLLQVSVAVLLDNFVAETAREQEMQEAVVREIKMLEDSIGNVLDTHTHWHRPHSSSSRLSALLDTLGDDPIQTLYSELSAPLLRGQAMS